MARLLDYYKAEVVAALKEELGITNNLQVPRLLKVVVSMGTGSPTVNKDRLKTVAADLTKITGQKADIRRSSRSVSNFKLRKDMAVGCRVTLRGLRMYEFVDRLVHCAIPRFRDFRGLNPRSFDGRGNYSMGVSDQSVFPEIDPGSITLSQGMNVTFTTSARDDTAGRALLTRLGMPFRKTESQSN